MEAKFVVIVLCLLLGNAIPSLAIENAQEAAQFVDRLLRSVASMKDLDSSVLSDVSEGFSRSFYAYALRGDVQLSEGTISGLTNIKRQGVPKFSKEDNISTIVATLRHPSLKIKYDQVDVNTMPYRKMVVRMFSGTVKDVKSVATFVIDEEAETVSLEDYEVIGGKDVGFRFIGGQAFQAQFQVLRGKDVAEAVKDAVKETVEQHVREILESAQ